MGQVRELIAWHWDSPLVTVSLAVDMQVRRSDFLSVRVAMWSTAEIQPRENHNLPAAILVGTLG